jgi:ATP-binding cassette subfamily B (MDR/TAP) protein 1
MHMLPTQIRDLALKFLYIAMATGVVSYIEMAAWMWSGNRQVNRLRLQYLEALLQQDVAFFDTEGTTGQALQGLNEDCQLIQVGQQADTTHMIM